MIPILGMRTMITTEFPLEFFSLPYNSRQSASSQHSSQQQKPWQGQRRRTLPSKDRVSLQYLLLDNTAVQYIQCCTIQYSTFSTLQYIIVNLPLYNTITVHLVPYNTAQYSTLSTVEYNTLVYCVLYNTPGPRPQVGGGGDRHQPRGAWCQREPDDRARRELTAHHHPKVYIIYQKFRALRALPSSSCRGHWEVLWAPTTSQNSISR